ncbi:MAG TPA: adenosine deaminase [Bryobacteraceae bacterium]|nr:adenosine deaminase [Bryobacteraceae bacterium]
MSAMPGAPMAELHIHLEGSIWPDTLRAIDPTLTPEGIPSCAGAGSFSAFIEAYKWTVERLRAPEHYALATRDLLRRLGEQGVSYAEITLSAGVILWKGQDLDRVFDAIAEESAQSPFPVFWIPDAIRHFGPEPARTVAEFAIRRRDDGIIAFGLGGDEQRGPAEWFADIFRMCRDGGLHLVCHAGETCGPESIRAALAIGAERIGHGISAVGDPGLMAELRDRDVPLEICITSNVCTGAVATLEEHPVRRLFDAGVPVTLNSDDPALFETTLTREYELAEKQFGFTREELSRIASNGFRYAFRRLPSGPST